MTTTAMSQRQWLLLEHAQRIGLPEPDQAMVHGFSSDVWLRFTSLDDLTEWAKACESPIHQTDAPDGSYAHFHIGHKQRCELIDQSICAYVNVPRVAGVPVGSPA